MGQEERTNRKQTVEKASAALDKVQECISAVNAQATQVSRIHTRVFDLEQHRTTVETRFNAQGLLITDVERTLGTKVKHVEDLIKAVATESQQKSRDYALAHAVTILRRQERFETLGLWERLRWVLFGELEPLEGPARVSREDALHVQ